MFKNLFNTIKSNLHKHDWEYADYGDLSYERGPTIRRCTDPNCLKIEHMFYCPWHDDLWQDGYWGNRDISTLEFKK